MNTEILNRLIGQAEERKLKLRSEKGAEYTRNDIDPLKNFKRAGEACGVSPMQAWLIYAHKHWDAICSYSRVGKEQSSEPIQGRIDDLSVYLDLLRGLVHEKETGSEV